MVDCMHKRLKAILETARGLIRKEIKATQARLNRTRTYLLRIGFKAEDTFVESREIDELLNNVYPGSQPRTRSIKRQKTRGPGQPKHRQEDTEQRRKLLLRDLRTLPAGCPWSLVVRVEVRGASEESDGDSESEEQAGDYIAITPDVFRYEPCGHAMLECEYRLTTSAASAKIHLWNAGGSPVKMRVSSSSSSSSSGDYEMEKGKGTIIKHDCDEGGEWECADEDGIKWLRVRLIKA